MKRYNIFSISCVICVLLFLLTGCSILEVIFKPTEFLEDGDFIYYTEEIDDEKMAYIVGFTESGFEKEELVFPTTINEYKVVKIGYSESHKYPNGRDAYNEFYKKGSNINKLFLPADINLVQYDDYDTLLYGIDKLIFLSTSPYVNDYVPFESVIDLTAEREQYYLDGVCSKSAIVPIGYKEAFNEIYPGDYIEANIQFQINYEIENLDEIMETYREEKNYTEETANYVTKRNYLLYRWEQSKNEGVHWIDHLDNDQTLTTIPQDPTRDGYSFGGWYFEEECINKVILEEIKANQDGTPLCLYAKWNKI